MDQNRSRIKSLGLYNKINFYFIPSCTHGQRQSSGIYNLYKSETETWEELGHKACNAEECTNEKNHKTTKYIQIANIEISRENGIDRSLYRNTHVD